MNKALTLCVLATALVAVAASVRAGDLICGFQARGLSMSFGALNPSSGTNATAVMSAATVNADQAGDCLSLVTVTIDGDAGQSFSGSRRLRNVAGTDFIPYTLVGLPISRAGPGNKKYTSFTFSGQILWSAYANASAGSYSDTVMISITP